MLAEVWCEDCLYDDADHMDASADFGDIHVDTPCVNDAMFSLLCVLFVFNYVYFAWTFLMNIIMGT